MERRGERERGEREGFLHTISRQYKGTKATIERQREERERKKEGCAHVLGLDVKKVLHRPCLSIKYV